VVYVVPPDVVVVVVGLPVVEYVVYVVEGYVVLPPVEVVTEVVVVIPSPTTMVPFIPEIAIKISRPNSYD